jgi:hypothetical protein
MYVLEVSTRRGTDTFVVDHAGRVADMVDRLRTAGERERRGIAQAER